MPNTPPNLSPEALSKALMALRKTYGTADDFPGQLPATLSESYDVQDISRARWDDELYGWKVAGIGAARQELLGAAKMTGPVFLKNVVKLPDGGAVDVPIFAKGFGAPEPEYMITLKDCAAMPNESLTLEQILSVVETIHIGVEIASGPFANVSGDSTIAAVADFGNNWGLVLGPELKNWREMDLTKIDVICEIDGKEVGRGQAGEGLSGPFGSVKFLIEHHKARGHDLPAGTVVSSGAIGGVTRMKVGSRAKVSFAGLGDFDIGFFDPLA